MERNPLIVVSSRLDRGAVDDRGGGVVPAVSSIISAWRRAEEADVGNTIVDCHDPTLAAAVKDAGAYSVTSDVSEFPPTHNYKPPSGLARVARTVTKFDRFCNHDLIIHLPEHYAAVDPKYLRALMYPLASSDVGMATLAAPIPVPGPVPESADDDNDQTMMSVDWNEDRKVYVMPEARVGTVKNLSRKRAVLGSGEVFAHIPIYIYRRAALDRIVRIPPSARELDENIEALRAFDLGLRIEALFVPEGVPTSLVDSRARYD